MSNPAYRGDTASDAAGTLPPRTSRWGVSPPEMRLDVTVATGTRPPPPSVPPPGMPPVPPFLNKMRPPPEIPPKMSGSSVPRPPSVPVGLPPSSEPLHVPPPPSGMRLVQPTPPRLPITPEMDKEVCVLLFSYTLGTSAVGSAHGIIACSLFSLRQRERIYSAAFFLAECPYGAE